MSASSDRKWWVDALCRGKDPWLWDVLSLPTHDPMRYLVAEERCSGCPVLQECGLDALEHGDRDVIRAGVPLGLQGVALFVSQERLREKLGIPKIGEYQGISWPRPCGTCGNYMRPKTTPAFDFPGTVASASHNECSMCAKRRMRNGGTDPGPVGGLEITSVRPV